MAGTFASDGVSAITSGNFDFNLGGAISSNVSSGGNFTCCDGNGRGTGGFSTTNPPGFVVYQINSSDAFVLLGNDVWGAEGEAIGIPAGTNFAQRRSMAHPLFVPRRNRRAAPSWTSHWQAPTEKPQ